LTRRLAGDVDALLQIAVFDFFEFFVERAASDSQEFAGLAFVASALGEDGFDVA
jgi:hypothetical protein